jgi:hypothetical protein
MKKLLFITALSFTPAIVYAHPGHFEGAPFAHALAHGLHYLFAAIAAGIMAAQKVTALRRARAARKS